MSNAHIYIGASGWYYEHWKDIFYTKEIKSKDRLNFYAQNFDTVEINNTFYNIPSESTIDNWFSKVPSNFIFSVKASRYITHRKRLKNFEESTPRFFERIEHLKEKLGPILFQLPPSFKLDLQRLEDFISQLKKDHLYTFEFRHPSCYTEDTYNLLKKYSIALCITDLRGHVSPEIITAKFVYIRLHGPKSGAYQGEYGPKLLKSWQRKIEEWVKNKLSIYCYFDNDEKSYAIKDAQTLKRLLGIS